MPQLVFHPGAATAINADAEELILAVTERPKEQGKSWEPDLAVEDTITAADIIGEIDAGTVTLDGRNLSLDFSHDGKLLTLAGEHYVKGLGIVALVLKNRLFREQISDTRIEEILRDWIRKRYRKQSNESFTDFLVRTCESEIQKFSVWTPLEQVYVQTPFRLGLSEIRPISQEVVNQCAVGAPDDETRNRAIKKFNCYRGHAASVVASEGEPERAKEYGRFHAERSLAGLALCSPGAFHCTVASAASLWGDKRLRQASSLLFVQSQFKGSSEGAIAAPPVSESFDNERLKRFAPVLKLLDAVLNLTDSNPLAEKIVDALLVYRRAVATPDPAEKLIYVFVALEMLLIRDANEHLQDNVGVRSAFLMGESVNERRKIISSVKTGYKLRSAFIHHGAQVEDHDGADEFLVFAWRTLVALLDAARRYKSQSELINALENERLRGGLS